MALTSATARALHNAELDKLFEKQRDIWLAMAKEAYEYTKGNVEGVPKRDDVAPHLALALESGETYSKAAKRYTAKHWYRDFADLIIDETWPELTKGEEASHASNEGSNRGRRPAARPRIFGARPSGPKRAR